MSCNHPRRNALPVLLAAWALSLSGVAGASPGATLVVTCLDTPSTDGSAAEPLPGATVSLSSDSSLGAGRYGLRRAIANSRGIAILPDLPPGGYWFEVSLEGFWPRKWFVQVHEQLTHRVTVEISPYMPDCTLGEFWDFRTLLDPAVPITTTIVDLGTNPP